MYVCVYACMWACSRRYQCLTHIPFILPCHCAPMDFQLPISLFLNLGDFCPNHRRLLCPGTYRKTWELTFPGRISLQVNTPGPLPLGRDNDETCILHPFPSFSFGTKRVSHQDGGFANTHGPLPFPMPIPHSCTTFSPSWTNVCPLWKLKPKQGWRGKAWLLGKYTCSPDSNSSSNGYFNFQMWGKYLGGPILVHRSNLIP